MMRSEEDAKRLVEYAVDAQGQPPISMLDIQAVNDGDVLFTKPKAPAKDEKQDYTLYGNTLFLLIRKPDIRL